MHVDWLDIEIGKHYSYEEGSYMYIKEVLVVKKRKKGNWLEFDLKVIDSSGQSVYRKNGTLTVGKDLSVPEYMSGSMLFTEIKK